MTKVTGIVACVISEVVTFTSKKEGQPNRAKLTIEFKSAPQMADLGGGVMVPINNGATVKRRLYIVDNGTASSLKDTHLPTFNFDLYDEVEEWYAVEDKATGEALEYRHTVVIYPKGTRCPVPTDKQVKPAEAKVVVDEVEDAIVLDDELGS